MDLKEVEVLSLEFWVYPRAYGGTQAGYQDQHYHLHGLSPCVRGNRSMADQHEVAIAKGSIPVRTGEPRGTARF